MLDMLQEIWKSHVTHRNFVLKQIEKSISTNDLRKHKKPNKWSIEELLRHILQANEWWYYKFILDQNEHEKSAISIGMDEYATYWVDFSDIENALHNFDSHFMSFLEINNDISLKLKRPQYKMDVTLLWVVYHLLQHELETLGMVAERIRTYGYPTPWEF